MRTVNKLAASPKAPRTRHVTVASVADDLVVKREIRLALFEKAIERLLSAHESGDFIVFELRGRPDCYVQYTLHDGVLLGEVSVREWIAGGEVLDKEGVTALGCLGFDGGLRGNFARDHLPDDARRVACLTELLLGAAYRPGPGFDVLVLTKSEIEEAAAMRRSQLVAY
jgi:hypothetical protein